MKVRKRRFTKLQGQYLAFIHRYTQLHGQPPSQQDLQRYFKVTPPSIHQMVVRLHELGLIERTPRQARSLRVVVPMEELPELGEDEPDVRSGSRQSDRDGSARSLRQSVKAHEEAEERLLEAIKANRDALDGLLEGASSHWGYEDLIYRFYHQSFKVYGLQESTGAIVDALRAISLEDALDPWFEAIVAQGTGLTFELEHNARWPEMTRPIVEAFFHAKYFLEMVCKYGRELDSPPQLLPSGWAAVLCLYGLR